MTEEMDEIMAPTPEDNLDSNDTDVNTALTPSSSDTPVCKRFLRRRCTFGATCKFLHPGAEELLDELLTRSSEKSQVRQCFDFRPRRTGNQLYKKQNIA